MFFHRAAIDVVIDDCPEDVNATSFSYAATYGSHHFLYVMKGR